MDVRGNHSSEDVPEEESFITRLPEWARERADGRWYGSPATGRSSRRAKPKAATKLIVVVPDEGEDDWAKARVFDNPGQATALVEVLVDDGLAPERVSIFRATQMVIDVAYRPLVQLTESSKQEEAPGTV
jgi:hypothetical protein